MRLQKTLVETHEFPNGELQAVLYDNDDKVAIQVMKGQGKECAQADEI